MQRCRAHAPLPALLAALVPLHAHATDLSAMHTGMSHEADVTHRITLHNTLETDFSGLPERLDGLTEMGSDLGSRYFIVNEWRTARTTVLGDTKVLTGSESGNQAEIAILFDARRTNATVATAPYRGAVGATLRFLRGGSMDEIAECTRTIPPRAPAQSYRCTAEPGESIQAVSWKGDALMIEKVTHANVAEPTAR